MQKLLYIAAGGACGAVLRYLTAQTVHMFVSNVYPWGTLLVNLIGSFLAGFIWFLTDKIMVAPHVKLLIMVGILGGFTTFSTYMLETLHLLRDGEIQLAVGNLLLNNVLGLVLVFSGFIAAHYCLNLLK